ncbi:MAG: hypothetical protein Q8K82_03390 [Gemmatimonadaceae bacterium]|nr:hypothetical protein [Gemmatimonadaceae bacterium]
MRHSVALLVALAALGCDAGARDDGAVAFAPPAVYERWWALTESCSGLSGSLTSVEWRSAPASALQAAEGAGTVAYWSSRDNRIVLATNAVTNGRIVRHEMLHALSRSRGHPTSLFRVQCAGVVRCDEACKGDADVPPQTSTAIRVPVDSLDMSIASFPAQPSSGVDDGAFQIIVSVTNPATHAVVVRLRTTDPAIAVSISPGELRLTADHEVGDPRLALFEPGERKQYVFDLRANDPRSRVRFKAGEYQLIGSFDGIATVPLALIVGP